MFPLVSASLQTTKAPPIMTFSGPDSNSQMVAVNNSGQEVARFTVQGNRSSFSIARHLNCTGLSQTICTGKTSSLSGNMTIQVHGQEVKIKALSDSVSFQTPMGPLKWVRGMLEGQELRDVNRTAVAKGSGRKKQLEVFVQGDEVLLDQILVTWVAWIGKFGGGGGGEGLKAGLELVAALGGGGA